MTRPADPPRVEAGAPPSASPRNDAIDGLRGSAALAVLGYHVATTPGGTISSWISPLGTFAVAVFFAVSGFLLWRPVARTTLEARPPADLRAFFTRRAARILPGYWVAATVGFWLLDSGRPHSVAETLTQYTLTQVYRRGDPAAGLFVTWTLAAEIVYYLLVATLAVGLARLSTATTVARRSNILLVVVAALAVFAAASRQLILGGEAAGTWRREWATNFVDWFAWGMLVATARARAEVGAALPRLLQTALRLPWLWWALAAETYFVLTRIAAHLASGAPLTAGYVQVLYLLMGVGSTALLVPVVLGRSDRGPAVPLRSAPAAFVGRISFGIYLWHAVWLRVIDRWSADGSLSNAFLPRLGVTLALTVPSAWLSWVLVERPCIEWARTRTASLRQPGRVGPEPVT